MRKALVVLGLVVLGIAAWWLLRGQPMAPSTAPASTRAQTKQSVAAPTPRSGAGGEAIGVSPGASDPAIRERIARRTQMRRRILDALEARERAAREHSDEARTGSSDTGSAGPPADDTGGLDEPDDPGPPTGGLVDRTGTHNDMTEMLNEDLMPMVDECYGMARGTEPELEGLLTVEFEIISDQDIGSVVESVTLADSSELRGPALVECIQQSVLSLSWPRSEQSGRDAISLSLRLSPDEP